jgi:hypothetical protein
LAPFEPRSKLRDDGTPPQDVVDSLACRCQRYIMSPARSRRARRDGRNICVPIGHWRKLLELFPKLEICTLLCLLKINRLLDLVVERGRE